MVMRGEVNERREWTEPCIMVRYCIRWSILWDFLQLSWSMWEMKWQREFYDCQFLSKLPIPKFSQILNSPHQSDIYHYFETLSDPWDWDFFELYLLLLIGWANTYNKLWQTTNNNWTTSINITSELYSGMHNVFYFYLSTPYFLISLSLPPLSLPPLPPPSLPPLSPSSLPSLPLFLPSSSLQELNELCKLPEVIVINVAKQLPAGLHLYECISS